MNLLGIDIGGTKIEAAVFNYSPSAPLEQEDQYPVHYGKIQGVLKKVCSQRIPTQRDKGYEHILGNLTLLCQEVIAESNLDISAIKSIGIGLPGTVHPQKQMMINGNSQVFINHKIAEDLRNALKLKGPVFVENDANCFALAEVLCGAGVQYAQATGVRPTSQLALGIILGTGVGGGIIYQGKILHGKVGGAGEVGHHSIHSTGRKCYCGRVGCSEEYLSGPGIFKTFKQIKGQANSSIKNTNDVFKQYDNGDQLAVETINAFLNDLSVFLGNLTNIFNPDYFVLGGGVSKQKLIYEKAPSLLKEMCFLPEFNPQIYQHQIGDSAGVLGAAILGLDSLEN